MRNLRNTRHSKLGFSPLDLGPITATAWDASDDSLILAFGPSEGSPAITLKRLPNGSDPEDCVPIASWDAPSPNPEIEVDSILDLHCFPEEKATALVLAGGDIIVVREDPKVSEDAIEIVGSVDAGIKAATWSPDDELLAICTAAETLLFMTRDFEGIANITISPDDISISNHVSVGWGKKETQFKGRGVAKTLRDPTVPEHVDEGTLSPFDDGSVTIAWRGDGQYVAINSVLDSKATRRIIRVYSRDGTLKSVSEPVNGLEAALSWKPSGQTIAGIQRLDGKIDVVFFERNGLRHGEFSLRLEDQEMPTTGLKMTLSWSVDSTVLAVTMADRLQLWTMSNYHYYLKQEIRFSDPKGPGARTCWHPEKPLRLLCTNVSDLRILSYKFEVCRGSVAPPNDRGIVAVIDGKHLKVTPLRLANIPPPMAFEEIVLPDNALDVVISEEGKKIAVLHHDSISWWGLDYSVKPPTKATLISVARRLHRPADESCKDGESRGRDPLTVAKGQNAYARTDHDRIFFYDAESAIENEKSEIANTSNHAVDAMDLNGSLNSMERNLVKESEQGLLQIQTPEKTLQIANSTSYIVTPMHLVYTTSQNFLKFIDLGAEALQEPSETGDDGELCRSIERGAKIVTVVPSACSLILQMPRGNLETIYPQALVLAGVRKNIERRDYKVAFMMCRTHRVDMNILHDYMPEQFMRNVELFVEQIRKAEYMDLFLSSLSEEDVCQTIYKRTIGKSEESTTNGASSGPGKETSPSEDCKVNKICDTILHVLQKQSPMRLQNVVTAHVCKSPPDLEAGLKLVSTLRVEGNEENLEQAVEHICFLGDVNKLYDTALGIYDLDVALLVAQQSQKDPREYLPYLQGLHDVELLRRKFAIDNDLMRYGKAITHLYGLDDFHQLKTYMAKHDLYSIAINLYRYDNIRLNELMRMYADHLYDRNNFKEAGIAYEYVSDNDSAYKAFRAAIMWRECLFNAALIPVSTDELRSIAEDLANTLEEAKDFKGSATIHLEYLKDLAASAKLLCRAYEFEEAMRLAVLHKNLELLSTVVDPGLVDASATVTELLAEMKSQLEAQIPRLRELRRKKLEDPIAFLDEVDVDGADIPDNLSLAPTDASTSGGTFMTRYTNRSTGTLATNATRKTSKNRRREERKRARGKKGTVYEEEYIVNSISRLIERLKDVGADVAKLVEGLMRRKMRQRAVAVQEALDDVARICKETIAEVFQSRSATLSNKAPDSAADTSQSRPWGGQGVLWDAERSLDSPQKEAPTLKSFERLSLLD